MIIWNILLLQCIQLIDYFDVGYELADIVKNRYGYIDYDYGIAGASTDFVNVVPLSTSLELT